MTATTNTIGAIVYALSVGPIPDVARAAVGQPASRRSSWPPYSRSALRRAQAPEQRAYCYPVRPQGGRLMAGEIDM
ncbi:MAG: hypothetical protein M3072_08600, partial [Candidatus Dormibacteraeota bacterium]|nr:hypothetical protein [Candidatus Dormibacteraeota bacterium]